MNLTDYRGHMKTKIEELLKCSDRVVELKAELKSRVLEVARRVFIAEYLIDIGHGEVDIDEFKEWRVTMDSIVVKWVDREDEDDEFSYPAEYLYNEAALVTYEEKRIAESEAAKLKAKDKQRKKDEAEYLRLGQKLRK